MSKACQQKMFNHVAKHLIKQGQRSTDRYGACQFRGQRGRMCAVGVLIPDSMYRPAMEGGTRNLFFSFPKVARYLGGDENLELLVSLQMVHDSEAPSTWPKTLRQVAKDFDLSARTLKGR